MGWGDGEGLLGVHSPKCPLKWPWAPLGGKGKCQGLQGGWVKWGPSKEV